MAHTVQLDSGRVASFECVKHKKRMCDQGGGPGECYDVGRRTQLQSPHINPIGAHWLQGEPTDTL